MESVSRQCQSKCPFDFKIIGLVTPGFFTIVDSADFERFFLPDAAGNPTIFWYGKTSRSGIRYAVRRGQALHRLVIGAGPSDRVDHIDTDGLNNRRANLRLATPSQNAANQRKTRGTSRYKGVYFLHASRMWLAQITIDGDHVFIGTFHSEEAAARAYNETAKVFFGEFARLNVLPEPAHFLADPPLPRHSESSRPWRGREIGLESP